MFWLKIPALVATNKAGRPEVTSKPPMYIATNRVGKPSCKYPALPYLQMLKRSLELGSLACQPSPL